MYERVEVAAISFRPKKWDKAANADRMEELFVRAAQDSPRLILTTEGALEGYVVMEIVEGRASPDRMLEVAEPIDGPYIRRFQKLARSLKTCLAFGFAERIGDEAYNCALFLDQQGEICGKYHKVQLAEGTHQTWRFNRVGSRLRAFDTPIGRAGIRHLQRSLEPAHRTGPCSRRRPYHSHSFLRQQVQVPEPGRPRQGT